MARTFLALTLTGALAFWSLGCEADRPGDEPGSPPPQHEREPGSPEDHHDEPGSPDDDYDEPGSPDEQREEPGSP